jgi:phosphatidate cytidylyltransferase
MQIEKGVLVLLLLRNHLKLNQFIDLKMRFLSSIGLVIFAYVFYSFSFRILGMEISNFLLSSVLIVFIYAILIYEWHVASFKNKKLIDILVIIFITCGVLAFSFVNMLRFQPVPISFELPIIWIVLTAIFTDTGAYFVGRMIGGHRPFTVISPGKTVSGYIGGLVFGGFVPLATGVIMQKMPLDTFQILYLVLIGICLSVASMAGDLLQSYFKRKNNVKDTGSILPGHGGLFDRFDGILGASCMLLCIWCVQIMVGL